MDDVGKTKDELLKELAELRRRTIELEAAETNLKSIEDKLVESEDRYRDLVEKAEIGILIDDEQGEFSYFNKKFCELFGYTMDEMVNQSIGTLVHPDDVARVMEYHKKRLAGGQIPPRYEFKGVKKDGSPITLEVHAVVLKEHEKIIGTRSYIWDISARKRIEQELERAQESLEKRVQERTSALSKANKLLRQEINERQRVEELLRGAEKERALILDSMTEFVIYHDANMKILWANKAAAKSVGVAPEQLIGHHCYEILQRRSLPCEGCPVEKCLKDNAPTSGEMTTPDGRNLFVRGYPVKDADGKNVGCVEVAMDITVVKKAEDALQESEARYKALYDRSLLCVYVHDLEGKFLDANNTALNLLGYTRDEIPLLTIASLMSDDQLPLAFRTVEEIKQNGYQKVSTQYSLRKKDGTHVWVETDGTLIYRDGKAYAILVLARDITERKQALDALQHSERKYKILTENINVGIYRNTVGSKGKFIEANPTIIKMFGYQDKGDFLSLDVADLYQNSEDRKHFNEKMLNEGFVKNEELRLKKKNGTPFWGSVSAVAVKDENGEVKYYDGIIEDITEFKNAERLQISIYKISEAAHSSQSLEELYGSIHEIISELMAAKNFYIALYDTESDAISFPYHVDEFDKTPKPRKAGKGLTEYVLRTGQSLLASGEVFKELERKGEVELIGADAVDWLGAPLRIRDKIIGVLAVQSYSENVRFKKEHEEILKFVSTQVATAIERKRAESELKHSYVKLQQILNGTVSALASTSEKRDPYTAGHQHRVTQLACAIAKEMGFTKDQIEEIKVAGIVHDIGKIYVAAEILSKPVKLRDIEMALVKAHCQAGYEILKTIAFPWPVAEVVYQHHERMDGSGYPRGLRGEEILPEARILGVADVVEAMSSHRPYRSARSLQEAMEEISKNRGKLYDATVVDVCLKLFNEKGFKFQ
jgi:PAS domain S-box-containing protein/putative nucleotidyltransferase with HDIG domain